MTSTLCMVSLCFAKRLKSQVAAYVREFGSSDPHVERLQLIYCFIMRFSIVFLISILCTNLVMPTLFVTLNNFRISNFSASYTWTRSFSTLIMTLYLIEINLMQLLILLFHHRLDEQKQKAKRQRNSIDSNSAYSMSSDELGPNAEIVTLYSSVREESSCMEQS